MTDDKLKPHAKDAKEKEFEELQEFRSYRMQSVTTSIPFITVGVRAFRSRTRTTTRTRAIQRAARLLAPKLTTDSLITDY
jgi:hypothetical protein